MDHFIARERARALMVMSKAYVLAFVLLSSIYTLDLNAIVVVAL